MIIPDDLVPLPVRSSGDEPAGGRQMVEDDFVSAVDIRRVLLGGRDEAIAEGLPADDFDSFAGRSDVPYPSRSVPAPTAVPVEKPRVAVEEVDPELRVLHPAFEILAPEPRRAAPPKPRVMIDREASFGRSKVSDFWWVLGMGFAVIAILLSGTVADLVSRETTWRGMSHIEPVNETFRGAPPEWELIAEEESPAVALTKDPDER